MKLAEYNDSLGQIMLPDSMKVQAGFPRFFACSRNATLVIELVLDDMRVDYYREIHGRGTEQIDQLRSESLSFSITLDECNVLCDVTTHHVIGTNTSNYTVSALYLGSRKNHFLEFSDDGLYDSNESFVMQMIKSLNAHTGSSKGEYPNL